MKSLVGKKFGRLLIIKEIGKDDSHNRIWECKCNCGNTVSKITALLTKKTRPVRSCGCLRSEHSATLNRLKKFASAKNRLIFNYRKSAKRKKLEFSLTQKEFFRLVNQRCHYCGTKPIKSTKIISPHSYGHILYNGIDRIDNSKGYTKDNTVPCCRNCNFAKNNLTYNGFISYIKQLVSFWKDK